MEQKDEPISSPVGSYHGKPVYAARYHTLDHPMVRNSNMPESFKRPLQALIMVFDELQWINV